MISRAISLLERSRDKLRRDLERTTRGLADVADDFRRAGLDGAATDIERSIREVRRVQEKLRNDSWRSRTKALEAVEQAYNWLNRAFEKMRSSVEGRPRYGERLVDAMHWLADLREDLRENT